MLNISWKIPLNSLHTFSSYFGPASRGHSWANTWGSENWARVILPECVWTAELRSLCGDVVDILTVRGAEGWAGVKSVVRCLLHLPGDTSSAVNVQPCPSPGPSGSLLSSTHPSCLLGLCMMRLAVPPLQGWTDGLIYSNYPLIRFLHIALKIKGVESHFLESDRILYCSTFLRK